MFTTVSWLFTLVGLTAAAPKTHSHEVLNDQCLLFAADPKNPWALAHGITALGPLFVAADGRKATDVIVSDYLMENRSADGGYGVGAKFGFARFARDGTPVEPHTNLIAKTFVSAKLPLSTRFKARWGPVSLKEIVEEARKSFRHVPESQDYWKDAAWTLDLLSQTTPPNDVAFNRVMDDALFELEKATADLKQGLSSGAPMVKKAKQGIYSHPCGGLHFVQAVLSWARHASVRARWGKRVEQQIAILMYRLDSERRQYDEALTAGGAAFRVQILTQMVKFYGHFLETTARFKKDLSWRPSALEKQQVAKAVAYLDNATQMLERDHTLTEASMKELQKQKPQIYLDLIGDACHATHGLSGWR